MLTLSDYINQNSIPEPNSGCWIWERLGDVGGYGRGKYRGRRALAHRLAWESKHGAIRPGLDVCHKCDTPLCVNPDHLFLGTHTENTRDMVSKGRRTAARGEAAGMAKLTREQVRFAVESPLPGAWVARQLRVGRALVSKIRRGQCWRHERFSPPPRYLDGREVLHLSAEQIEAMADAMVAPA